MIDPLTTVATAASEVAAQAGTLTIAESNFLAVEQPLSAAAEALQTEWTKLGQHAAVAAAEKAQQKGQQLDAETNRPIYPEIS